MKGQLFSGDFVLSVAIFLVVVAVLLLSFTRISEQTREEDLRTDLESGSLFATDVLMKTEGFPGNWDNTTVIVPGFVENGTLSSGKVSRFLQLDYDRAKYALGLSEFDFSMNVTGLNDTVIFEYVKKNLTQADGISVTNRVGVMGGQIVKIRFLVWK